MRRADPHHDTRFGPTQTIVAPDFFDPDGGFLILCSLIVVVLNKQMLVAFMANPGLNALIIVSAHWHCVGFRRSSGCFLR